MLVAIFKHLFSSGIVEIKNKIDSFRVSPTINCTLQRHIPISIFCQQFSHQVVASKKPKLVLQNCFSIRARCQRVHNGISRVNVTLREYISRNVYQLFHPQQVCPAVWTACLQYYTKHASEQFNQRSMFLHYRLLPPNNREGLAKSWILSLANRAGVGRKKASKNRRLINNLPGFFVFQRPTTFCNKIMEKSKCRDTESYRWTPTFPSVDWFLLVGSTPTDLFTITSSRSRVSCRGRGSLRVHVSHSVSSLAAAESQFSTGLHIPEMSWKSWCFGVFVLLFLLHPATSKSWFRREASNWLSEFYVYS